MIHFKPFLGLANRMRAMNSAVALANHCGIKIKIFWVKDLKLNAKFSDLFVIPEDLSVQISEPVFSFYTLPFTIRYPTYMFLVKLLFKVKYSKSIIINNLGSTEFDIAKLNTDKNIFIAAFNDFYKADFNSSLFIPTEDIAVKIDDVSKSFSKSTYGIHIRRTDNPISIDLSPTNLYVKEIDTIISQDNNARFYLATDSLSEKEFLINKYQDRIITSIFNTSRQSTEGMKNAVIDLFALSRTRMIIGSYFSSFSDIAAALGKIPLRIIKK